MSSRYSGYSEYQRGNIIECICVEGVTEEGGKKTYPSVDINGGEILLSHRYTRFSVSDILLMSSPNKKGICSRRQ